MDCSAAPIMFARWLWCLGTNAGTSAEAVAIYGGITFDGNGNYNFNGQIYDPASH